MAENDEAKNTEEGGDKKTKKITRSTMAELDALLVAARKSMGGDQSRYVRHLLAKKKVLASK